MAEYVMKDLTSKAGLSEQFEIASAATSAWEIGNPVYPPARQKLAEHGIDCNGKTARQMTRLDYARYDHLIKHSMPAVIKSSRPAALMRGAMTKPKSLTLA